MEKEEEGTQPPEQQRQEESSSGGGGWGGWGLSSFSILSELQKAAEEISKNAVEVAKNAAKSITEVQTDASNSESATAALQSSAEVEEEAAVESNDGVEPSKNDILRNSALDRLEQASQDTLLGQGLRAFDNSVESLASGAWRALGNAWKGSSTLVHKLEHSAVNLADSIQHGALPVAAPSIIETGKSFTARSIQVLERVGKETMELLITEAGLEVENSHEKFDHQSDEENSEEVNFERCFYIYGGPELLEELEALSNHYALLLNRKKTKLLSEQKSFYDVRLKQIQQVLNLGSEIEENETDLDKGKHMELEDDASVAEMKILHDSSVKKAADIATGFAATLGGLSMNEVLQRTADRLETAHVEGVHRLSELCSVAVSHLLVLGKSVISDANKLKSEKEADDIFKVDWPEDSVSKAKIIRSRAQVMSGDIVSVANSFITGILEIIDAYQVAAQSVSLDANEGSQQCSVQEKANVISNHLHADRETALGKIQDALRSLGYLVLSASMPTV